MSNKYPDQPEWTKPYMAGATERVKMGLPAWDFGGKTIEQLWREKQAEKRDTQD